MLINSQFFGGTGTRASTTVSLTGINGASTVQVRRLTAPAATSQTAQGSNVTLAGRSINSACQVVGTESVETITVVGGSLSVKLLASEAVFIQI
jgi:hypothetical protein